MVFVDESGVGKGAVDEGGPTREFCRLLMGQIQQHHIFEGPLDSRALALDNVALHNGIYRLAGQMVAVCLIQGGVSPHFFSDRLFRQVCCLVPLVPSIKEVADKELQAKLHKIATAGTVQEAREAVKQESDELSMM